MESRDDEAAEPDQADSMSLANDALQSIMRQARSTPPASFDTGYFLRAIESFEKHLDADPELVKDAHEAVHELRRRI